jgi:hypothetical protein
MRRLLLAAALVAISSTARQLSFAFAKAGAVHFFQIKPMEFPEV